MAFVALSETESASIILKLGVVDVTLDIVIPPVKFISMPRNVGRRFPFLSKKFFSLCPSFSQSTTYSLFPYHFLYAPPLLQENHLLLIWQFDTSCHRRRNKPLSLVVMPFRTSNRCPACSNSAKSSNSDLPAQYATGAPGIFLKSSAAALKKFFFSLILLLSCKP